MLKLFDRYILLEMFKNFILIILFFFPMLYLADFFLEDVFIHSEALKKIFFRYAQILPMMTILSVNLAIKRMRYAFSEVFFITIGFEKKDLWRVCLVFFFILSSFYAFVMIPSNDYFFEQQLKLTTWGIKEIDNNMFFINKTFGKISVWRFDSNKKIHQYDASLFKENLKFYEKGRVKNINFKKNDLYIIWNEPKKLSWNGLNTCKEYLKYHNHEYDHLTKQFHIYLSRIFLLLAMIICGAALGWKDSIFLFMFGSILPNWMEQIAGFLPMFYSIICSWANFLLWMIVGICLLLT